MGLGSLLSILHKPKSTAPKAEKLLTIMARAGEPKFITADRKPAENLGVFPKELPSLQAGISVSWVGKVDSQSSPSIWQVCFCSSSGWLGFARECRKDLLGSEKVLAKSWTAKSFLGGDLVSFLRRKIFFTQSQKNLHTLNFSSVSSQKESQMRSNKTSNIIFK